MTLRSSPVPSAKITYLPYSGILWQGRQLASSKLPRFISVKIKLRLTETDNFTVLIPNLECLQLLATIFYSWHNC
jgi:hypothetical protein